MATLYELTTDYMRLQEMLEDSEASEQAILDTMELIGGDIEDKADNYAKIIQHLKSLAEYAKKEANRLNKRAISNKKRAEFLKQALENCMRVTGKTNFKTALFSFSIQNKSVKTLVIDSQDDIPERYFIPQDPELSMSKLKTDLENGYEIAGCRLVQGEYLMIR